MSRKRSRISVLFVIACAFAWVAGGGIAEAKRGPSSIAVCVDPATRVVSRVASSKGCVSGSQRWSASQNAPQLCWDGTSLDVASRTRLVSIAPASGCIDPLRSVPVGKVVLLCADQTSGVLRWPVTSTCDTGNIDSWIRVGLIQNVVSVSTSTTTTTPNVALVPTVSLQTTVIQGNTWPKAVTVTANVAGTIYVVETSVAVKSVSDITNAHPMLWAQGAVPAANTATSITLNVENLVNGYYRVFVVTAQGVLSSPATNIVTISVHPASQVTTTTSTTVTVRTQTLDQNYSIWHVSGFNAGLSSTQAVGQSFTSGLTGPLSRVSLGLTKSGTVTQLTAAIYLADGSGNATGSALASSTISAAGVATSSGGALTNFDFTSPASVTAGTRYVIAVTTPDSYSYMTSGGDYLWFCLNGNGYSGGSGIFNPLSSPSSYGDLMFKTYVDI